MEIETPIKMDDLGGTTIFGNIHGYVLSNSISSHCSPICLTNRCSDLLFSRIQDAADSQRQRRRR